MTKHVRARRTPCPTCGQKGVHACCPVCGTRADGAARVEEVFGLRRMKPTDKSLAMQPRCKQCRPGANAEPTGRDRHTLDLFDHTGAK